MKTQFGIASITVLALGALLAMPVVAAEEDPMALITSAVDDIKVGLAANRATYEQEQEKLYEFVDELLAPRFDRNYAGRLVLGVHWRTASNEQKKRFIDGFYNAMLSRYAAGVLEFREELVEIMPLRGAPKGNRTQIKTVVTLDNDETVPVNYGLIKRCDAGWKVYDVTIEGISYIKNFRAEIDSEVKKTSLDAVIARLEKEASGE
ncbi:MAG: ABC transporter substrate-binding protein [Pseudomonadota bacterium]